MNRPIFAICLTAWLTACFREDEAPGVVAPCQSCRQPGAGLFSPEDEKYVAYLETRGFHRKDIVRERAGFLVEGDIIMTLETLEARMAADAASPTGTAAVHYKHIWLLTVPEAADLRLKIDASMAAYSTLIHEAVQAMNRTNSKVHIHVVTGSPDVTIWDAKSPLCPGTVAVPLDNNNICGKSDFPRVNGTPFPDIGINVGSTLIPTDDNKRSAIMHELGHIIGLRHTNTSETETVFIPGTPSQDPLSVMNGGKCALPLYLSVGDRLAMNLIYPNRVDLIVRQNFNSKWFLAPREATGTFFVLNQNSVFTGFPSSTHQAITGDANGDGRADIIGVETATGIWKVRTSTGTGFGGGSSTWMTEFPGNGYQRFAADVDGNGKADAIGLEKSSGNWQVGLSSGSTFQDPPTLWKQGFAIGGSANYVILLADVSGDGKADLIAKEISTGAWWVSRSMGNSFSSPAELWMEGWASGPDFRIVAGDFDGDGMSDLAALEKLTGQWHVAINIGGMFIPAGVWLSSFGGISGWLHHAGDVTGVTATGTSVGADGFDDLLAFDVSAQRWWVARSSGASFEVTGTQNGWPNTGGVSFTLAADASGN